MGKKLLSFLIVEDNHTVAKVNADMIRLRYDNAAVTCTSNGQEALSKIKKQDFNIILSDIDMPVMNGLEFYSTLMEEFPEMTEKIAFVSSNTEHEIALPLVKRGGRLLEKPYSREDFYKLIDSMMEDEKTRFIDKSGKTCERKSVRIKFEEKCAIKIIKNAKTEEFAIEAETIDYSESGFAIKYKKVMLGRDIYIKAFIEGLGKINEQARVVWSKSCDGYFIAGLQWV